MFIYLAFLSLFQSQNLVNCIWLLFSDEIQKKNLCLFSYFQIKNNLSLWLRSPKEQQLHHLSRRRENFDFKIITISILNDSFHVYMMTMTSSWMFISGDVHVRFTETNKHKSFMFLRRGIKYNEMACAYEVRSITNKRLAKFAFTL